MRMSVREIIDYSAACPVKGVTVATRLLIERLARSFSRSRSQRPSSVNIFTFHVDAVGDDQIINTIDMLRDNSAFDYARMTHHLFWSVEAFAAPATTYLVTGPTTNILPPPSVVHIPLEVHANRTMFHRVIAMCAYVHSDAFDKDTVFLDTDAFPNRDFGDVFQNEFDIGLTVRNHVDLMPINEGVIFASAEKRPAVQSFFLDYVARYESLCLDEEIRAYYGDIKRWRGGQLSLNALAFSKGWDGVGSIANGDELAICFFPCDPFNYSLPQERENDDIEDWSFLADKMVIHLKGLTKRHFSAVEEYQRTKFVPSSRSSSITGAL